MSTAPWYRDGLSFTCTQCGDCCTGDPGYVWVTRGEIGRLAKRVGLSVDDFGKRYVRRVGRRYSLIERQNGDCIFYDGGCTVYSARPAQCRTFPFWSENLKTRGAWDEVAEACPGVSGGKGRFYPLAQVQKIKRGDAEAGSLP